MKLSHKIIGGLFTVAVLGGVFYSNSPEQIAANEAQSAKYRKEAAEERAKEAELRAELSGTKCKRDHLAYIGESQLRTRKCGWGAPERINRTTTSTHVREQWVYRNGYLYFTDGVLTSYQN